MSKVNTPATSRDVSLNTINELLVQIVNAKSRMQRIRLLLTACKAETGAERAGLIVAQAPETLYWSDRTEHPEPYWVDTHERQQFSLLMSAVERVDGGYYEAAAFKEEIPTPYKVRSLLVLRNLQELTGLVLFTGDDVTPPSGASAEILVNLLTLVAIEQRTSNNLNKFLNDFAHDQRNNLSVVSMSADVLFEMPEMPAKSKLHLTRIFDNTLQVGNQIENALSVERYDPETDEYHMNLEQVDLVDLRREICDRYYQIAQGKRITIKQPYVRGPVVINADKGMITRALTNLVDNALKFTPDGGHVEVLLARSKGAIQVSVKDTGPGIASENLDRIFERKVRVRQTRYVRGLGLGLYIVRNVAIKHGGRAWVESRPGEGSTFYLSLPIKHNNGVK